MGFAEPSTHPTNQTVPVLNRLYTLEAGRGIASLLVVAFHTGVVMSFAHNIGPTSFGEYFAFGDCGVDFFFVLSGFIIFFSNDKRLGKPGSIAAYLKARFRRIYPLYWIVTLLLLLAGLGHVSNAPDLFSAVMLIPHDETPPVVGVAWTLEHEILFYALFSLLIVNIRFGAAILAIWQAIILAAIFGAFAQTFPQSFLLKNVNIEFMLGAAVFIYTKRFRVARYKVFAIGGAAIFLAISPPAIHDGAYALLGENARLLYGAAAALSILGWIEWERGIVMRVPAFLRFLGSASFAIYLTHIAVLTFAIEWVPRLNPADAVSPNAIFILLFLTATLAGCLLHLLVERPVLRLASRL